MTKRIVGFSVAVFLMVALAALPAAAQYATTTTTAAPTTTTAAPTTTAAVAAVAAANATTGSSTLPVTGASHTVLFTGIAAVLICMGGLFVLMTRKRKAEAHS